MVQAFKSVNPRWVDTKVVMSDKDFNECNMFKKEFPQATLQICLFHTLRSFRREITIEKMSIQPGERDHVLEIVTKLAYSKSDAEYDQNYQGFIKGTILIKIRILKVFSFRIPNETSIRSLP